MFRNAASRATRIAARAGAPRLLARSMSVAARQSSASKATAMAGAFLVTTGVTASLLQAQEAKVNLEKIRKEIVDLIDDEPAMGPTFVRLAWHSSGSYSKHDHSGGSKGGTIRNEPEINHGGNAGLNLAIARLESVKARHPEISYADLFIYSGVVAIAEMGGPEVPFHLGRKDAKVGEQVTPDDRLPAGDKGSKPSTISHIRDVFYRMGFNDREIVALVGAHAVGRCYPSRSGYSGPWTRAETTFSNEYFRELIENKWTIKKWKGPEQYEDPTGDLMMLPADMAFLWDPEFKKYVELYAKDEDLWHKDFAKAFQKLTENGCDFAKSGWRRYIFFGPRSD
ncbi:cytochrome c peroxidase [Saprolegnia diclina VS20]|uniref:Cytochrome c peroxidase, mitochondrial n=1 Tax=Saprolegnia diclina (strain VS20) TaxID=1156394 RepID=T0Q4G9_SAPDV|nr:cytochrome c peroxidase [Saprolegnia diclina VS20]EQC28335.1 cytochrome c peroxidase [Saprolegnia diclina VS20]|eukprot:XP_008618205.1 cytochrome c peroxidase [Saprolegnia diclina VS20]